MSFTFTDAQIQSLCLHRAQAEAGDRSWASIYDEIYSYITYYLTDPGTGATYLHQTGIYDAGGPVSKIFGGNYSPWAGTTLFTNLGDGVLP